MSKNPEKQAEAVFQKQEENILGKILEEGRLALREDQVDRAKDMLAEFVQQALQFTRQRDPAERKGGFHKYLPRCTRPGRLFGLEGGYRLPDLRRKLTQP